jgi:hypothetical protein
VDVPEEFLAARVNKPRQFQMRGEFAAQFI